MPAAVGTVLRWQDQDGAVRGTALLVLAGAACIAVYFALPSAGVAQAGLFVLVNVAAMLAAWRAVVRAAGATRFVWTCIASALTLAAIANVPYYGIPLATGDPLPFPSPADALFLATQPCLIVALIRLVRERRREDRRGDLLDTAIVVLGCTSLMWQFVIGPVVGAGGMSGLGHLVAVAFPVGDLVVFAMLVRLVFAGSHRNLSKQFLLTGIGFLLAADVLLAVQVANGSYGAGGPTDGLWMAYYTLFAVAALHPSASELSGRSKPVDHRITSGRLVFMFAAVLVGPFLLTTDPNESHVIAAVSVVVFALVMARMAGLNRRLLSVGSELEKRASTDSLTGLANRAAFHSRLEACLARTERRVDELAVLFVDLDDFKDVNDNLGHAAGDALLVVVADRMRATVRSGDLIARLGGDEFAILVEGPRAADEADALGQRVVVALAGPTNINGTAVHVGASLGLAEYRRGMDPDELMRNADVAMYSAKSRGKSRVERYDNALHDAVDDRHALRNDLREATTKEQLVVAYQPVVDLVTGSLVGVEALVRWQHPTRGLLPPSAFIGLAEETGDIVAIGSWVLGVALKDLGVWQRRYGLPELMLSVNVSMHQIEEPDFAQQVGAALSAAGVDPRTFVVEVTESLFADPAGGAAGALAALRAIGVRVALDDFGTGYSCIAALRTLPVDIIKIDRCFISGNDDNEPDHILVEAIVNLGRRLAMDVIPEGIETHDQLRRLREVGCRSGQGFLMSQPVFGPGIEALLATASPLLLPHTVPTVLFTSPPKGDQSRKHAEPADLLPAALDAHAVCP